MDISSLLEVEVKEGKASDFPNNVLNSDDSVTPKRVFPSEEISHDEKHFYKLMFGTDIASVRFRRLHCTSCDLHIGSAPADSHEMHEHPVLHVLLCTNCRNFYGDGTFEQGDDATDMFCRWCANGGNLYCCSYCSNTFCYNCIKRNFDAMVRKKIERDEKWKCFVCNPADLYTARAVCWALLQHVQTVTRILQSDRKMSPKEIEAKMNLDESQCCPHKKKRKRSETMSDDEDDDETYSVPKKRRKTSSSKRKRRIFKTEMPDPSTQEGKPSNESEDVYLIDSQNKNRAGTENPPNERRGKISPDEVPLALRQRNRRVRDKSTKVTDFGIDNDEIPAPLLHCDQSMIEGSESLSFGVSPTKQQPRVIGISPVPMANLLKKPGLTIGPLTRGGKSHRLVRGIGGTPVLVRKIAPANITVNSASSSLQTVPMVTIPSRNHTQQNSNRPSIIQPPTTKATTPSTNSTSAVRLRSRLMISKSAATSPADAQSPANATSRKSAPPSVINLDSDSDEPVVLVTPSREWQNSQSNDRVPDVSTVTYPVRPDDGLMMIVTPTPKNSNDAIDDDDNDDNEIIDKARESRARKKFNQDISGPTKSVDSVLDSMRNKLKKVMESAGLISPQNELQAAKAKTRAVNRTIKRTVAELTSLNDNLLRAYHVYKRERANRKIPSTDTVVLGKRQKSSSLTPLDMECTRESEAELDGVVSEDDDDADSQNIFPVREIRPFGRRVHRAIEAKPQTENKSIQVNDTVLRDCESSIGYTLLLKADYDSKRQRDILRPVVVPDENFGKYEEQFINYLQHIEDNGIVTEEDKEKTPLQKSISINELIEADIVNMIRYGYANNNEVAIDCAEETNVIQEETREDAMNDENIEIFEEHVEIVTTKSVTSDESSESSDNSDNETTSTTNTTPEKNNRDKIDDATNKEETEIKENEESNAPTMTQTSVEAEEKIAEETTPAIRPTPTKKGAVHPVDEETVLAVRALIEDDNNENDGNADILKNWKPVDSDDELFTR